MITTTTKTNNKITALLNIQYPVIQAAMVWLTSAEFVAAVSMAGGLGVLASNAGQTE
ncbi:nitronate monooxygenase [Orbus sturtevantii]